jgi:hypothetical protein
MTGIPRTLDVAGIRLPVVDTASGPRVSATGDLAGLATGVNAYLNDVLPDLPARLRRHEAVSAGGTYAADLADGLDPAQELVAWSRLSNSDLREDPVMVGTPGEVSVVPRSALLEILDRMRDLNVEAREGSTVATTPASAPSPAEVAGPDRPTRADLQDDPPADAPQARLASAVANRPGAPGRAEELHRLEARAQELDQMTDAAEAAARRRTLLIELDGAGLLSGRPGVTHELEDLELPTLLGYDLAARRLLGYLVSPERRELVPDALAEPVLGARVSLDFFRPAASISEGRSTYGWAAIGEALLVAASPGPTTEGQFYSQWDGRWYDVRWRRDDGNTPALLQLTTP